MKNLVQNGLVMVALILCLFVGFFINIMLAGCSLVVFVYLIYKMTNKNYLAYSFIVIPTMLFNGYAYYYLMVKEPQRITYYHKVLGVENDMITYEVSNDDITNNTRIERIKDETLANECKANNCNYISINEIISTDPEWLNDNYVKFSLIDIIHSYNNTRIINVSRITDNTSAYDSMK